MHMVIELSVTLVWPQWSWVSRGPKEVAWCGEYTWCWD